MVILHFKDGSTVTLNNGTQMRPLPDNDSFIEVLDDANTRIGLAPVINLNCSERQ